MTIAAAKKPIPQVDVRLLGTIHRDAVPIFIDDDVLDDVLQYSEAELNREVGGFLVGGVHTDKHLYVEIRHFIPATACESRAASLTFTHETWSTLTRQLESQYADEVLIGWQHTHPSYGIFLSGYDLFIQKNLFDHPWQVAMVVDPRRHEFGFFQWRDNQVVDCGFVVFEGTSA